MPGAKIVKRWTIAAWRTGYVAVVTASPPTRVRLCPDGPMLLSGEGVTVVTEDGREVTAQRRTVAVCRCGRSARAPWCDGSHKLLNRGPSAVTGAR